MEEQLERRSMWSRIFDLCNILFLFIFSVTVLYPFWHLMIISFSDNKQFATLGFHIWLSEWSTEAYKFVFSNNRIAVAYLNSILRVILGTSISIVVTLLAAYPLSKRRLPGRNFITLFFIFTMFFGGGLIPNYLLIRRLGLMDTRWALVLPGALNVFWVIIVRNFMMAVDEALEEAAFVDGANVATILFRIIVPIAKPAIATIFLWSTVHHWNSWFDALLYIRSNSKLVLQLLLRRMMNLMRLLEEIDDYRHDENILAIIPTAAAQAATILITIGPIILIYPFIQKYFIRGIMIGSLKG